MARRQSLGQPGPPPTNQAVVPAPAVCGGPPCWLGVVVRAHTVRASHPSPITMEVREPNNS
jgi:hypothetical protein